jgi:hypothetical protein
MASLEALWNASCKIINDEWDVQDAISVATLQKWAANKLKDFIRKKTLKGKLKRQRSNSGGMKKGAASATTATASITIHGDRTPLLQAGGSHNGSYSEPPSSFSSRNGDEM